MLANSVESPVRLGYITSLMIRMGCHRAFAFSGKRIFPPTELPDMPPATRFSS